MPWVYHFAKLCNTEHHRFSFFPSCSKKTRLAMSCALLFHCFELLSLLTCLPSFYHFFYILPQLLVKPKWSSQACRLVELIAWPSVYPKCRRQWHIFDWWRAPWHRKPMTMTAARATYTRDPKKTDDRFTRHTRTRTLMHFLVNRSEYSARYSSVTWYGRVTRQLKTLALSLRPAYCHDIFSSNHVQK